MLVVAIAVPLGVFLTRPFTRRFRGALLTVANIGQAVPTIGVLALLAVAFLFLGFWAAIVGLVAYAILPVLRNTMVGLDQVDAAVLEASPHGAVLVLDAAGRPRRWVGGEDLRRADGRPLMQLGTSPEAVVEPQATLSDALNELITARYSIATVVDGAGVYQGVVDIDRITEAIRSMREESQRRARGEPTATDGPVPEPLP